MSQANSRLSQQIAQELQVKPQQISATIELIDGGATVPFIARYRKEATGGLDDGQLRTLEQRLSYLRELNQRRDTILSAISEQGKLTESLRRAIDAADSKTALEDLYLPFKSKRRTKGQLAIEAGLEPFALNLLRQPQAMTQAAQHTRKGYDSAAAVLDGCQAILIEHIGNDPANVAAMREALIEGWIASKAGRGKADEHSKFRDYYDHQERYNKVPSHRALAMLRGKNQGELSLALRLEAEAVPRGELSAAERLLARLAKVKTDGGDADLWLLNVVQQCWKTKLGASLENELLSALQRRADDAAIKVFGDNLSDLLLAAPAGAKATLAIDPGQRTGCKLAALDGTGKLLDTATIYPHAPQKQWSQALATLATLVKRHQIELIAIGNGTASRETDQLVAELIAGLERKPAKVVVSEAGASVYSASELAANEFPQLDVSLRGAVSIGRRLQDPLAELVKIEPKAIGVGQYQHDVNQSQLAQRLDAVVEDCVNHVGVDLNSASAALLSRVAGLTPTLANNIVSYRDSNGRFDKRSELKKVPRLGPKAFEQCAGFLRISGGSDPLDGSGVHPEAYGVVKQMAAKTGLTAKALIGNDSVLNQLRASDFVDDRFGLPTVTDIISELHKPGRDPRGEFASAKFAEGVTSLNDLVEGMMLEGVVTNVTHFGAFVDIGVKQDGLVHISALADHFVDDPRKLVKTGQVVKVRVTEVDLPRKRIALSMKSGDDQRRQQARPAAPQPTVRSQSRSQSQPAAGNNAFADAFAKAKKR
ncbi:Tex family protein [Ferrimonas senticii]|uniref:Tex family protein n=1 Tax=Ferrimonas senticii TaxID=394566 RepID=UPI0004891327|nr:Tex family protein [Ferrimonas senticii]